MFTRFPTVTVVDVNGCNTRNVKEGEIYGRGRHCTAFANAVTELIHGAKIEQCGPGKKLVCPFLGASVR